MRVIFLDIDGVLNNKESWKKRYEYWQKNKVYISEIDEETVRRLSEIVRATDAKIVLSSSRRGDWKDGVDNLQIEMSKQLQELFNKYNIEVIGITPFIPKSNDPDEIYTSWRENEIKNYLDMHPEIESFCIIDDDIQDLRLLEEYLVKTNSKYGLQDKHIEEAIRILTTEKLCKSK